MSSFNANNVSTSNKKLSIFQNNIRGLNDYNFFCDWKVTLSTIPTPPDIIILSEVKLKPTTQISLYNLDGYALTHCLREADFCKGGLLVYVNNGISHKVVENVSTSFEKIVIEMSLCNKTFHLICLYRPPVQQNFVQFIDSLESSLEKCPSHLILAGDINVDKSLSSAESRKYNSLLTQFNIEITNDHPTRPASGKIIDHFACNFSTSLQITNHTIAQDPHASDHSIIYSFVNVNVPVQKQKRTICKDILNYKMLFDSFPTSLPNIINETDPNKAANLITNAIKKAISLSTTTVTVSVKRGDKIPPWTSGEMLLLLKQKDKLHEKWKRRPHSERNKILYVEACANFHTLNEKLRNSYYKNKFNTSDPKKIWRGINDILGKGQKNEEIAKLIVNNTEILDQNLIADSLNSFFTAPIHNPPPPNNHLPPNFDKPVQRSLFLGPTSNSEVSETIKSLKSRSSAGRDGITSQSIKKLRYKLVPLFVHLINLIFTTGVYPDVYKEAVVVPIFKGGDRKLPSNYRPISILPVCGKIVEKIIHSRVMQFLNKNKILIERQFGFRKKSGTESAAIEVISTIQGALNEGKKVSAVFMDLQKAFDSVDHEVLLTVLDKYGIRGKANDLIRSYLSNRSQSVRLRNSTSSTTSITQGVIQGSIIGPLLFLIIINAMGLLGTKGKIILYADDAVLLHSHNRNDPIEPLIISDMNLISSFLSARKLNLNESKTVFMVYHSPYVNINIPAAIKVSDVLTLKNAESFKYLGIYLDASLSFSTHTEQLEKKMASAVGVLWKLRKDLPIKCREMIYNSLIHSHLSYLVTCWGSASHNITNRLQVLQNRAIRNVYGLSFMHNRCEMYAKHNKLPLRGICLQRTAIYVYSTLNNLIHSTTPFSLRKTTREQNLLVQTHPYNSYGTKNISCFGPRTFNYLSQQLRNSKSLSSFKTGLNKFLLDRSFLPKLFDKRFLNIILPY